LDLTNYGKPAQPKETMNPNSKPQDYYQDLVRRGHIRNRKTKFNPNRAFIDDAVNDYLKKGGRIEKVEPGPDWTDLDFFPDDEIDSFLMGV